LIEPVSGFIIQAVTRERPYQPFERQISIPSDVGHLHEVHGFAATLLAGADYSEDEAHEILLALQEGVTNAIHHGNNGGKSEVSIRMALFDTHLEVSIRDQGEGFDPNCLQDPTLPEFRLRSNGRGILFIENFMDEVCFKRHNSYHELKMVRFR